VFADLKQLLIRAVTAKTKKQNAAFIASILSLALALCSLQSLATYHQLLTVDQGDAFILTTVLGYCISNQFSIDSLHCTSSDPVITTYNAHEVRKLLGATFLRSILLKNMSSLGLSGRTEFSKLLKNLTVLPPVQMKLYVKNIAVIVSISDIAVAPFLLRRHRKRLVNRK
jgi:hypothetical protein